MQKLILIDGNAILHRAYHALPPLTSPKGEPIQAVFGFFSMLLTILNDQKPEYLIICFDRPKPTFRQELYAGYHEHRPKIADEFVSQIVKVHEVVAQMHIPIFELDGFEADDLIGTLAHQIVNGDDDRKLKVENSDKKIEDRESIHLQSSTVKKPSSIINHPSSDIQVLIVSGDRDLLQLVNSHVMVLSPLVGLKTLTIYDEQKVEEKYGVKPSQFIDYKALIGDNSDGYPGVAGIGPKTAAGLIRKFETFENLYTSLDQVPEKLALKLATDAEQAALAKRLATIITDAPIHLDLEKAEIEKVHVENARDAFTKFGFNSLLKRLDQLNGHIEVSKVSKVSKAPPRSGQSPLGIPKVLKGETEESEQLGLL